MTVFYTKDQVDSQAGEVGKRLKVTRDYLKTLEQELEVQKNINKELIKKSEPKSFKFTVDSLDQSSNISRKITQFFDKNLSNYTATWTLLKNGVFLANSSGLKSSEGAVILTTDSIVINKESLDSATTDTYELITYATYLKLEDLSSESNLDKITINSFGSRTKNCKFNVKGDLEVPSNISENLEDFSGMFEGSISFNQDISAWDVKNIKNMDSMFKNSSSFNQDLSSWNVDLIIEEPFNFSLDATSWVLPQPKWGEEM